MNIVKVDLCCGYWNSVDGCFEQKETFFVLTSNATDCQFSLSVYAWCVLFISSEATLRWETFEQYCVWQLLSAHDIEVEHLLPVVSKLRYRGRSSMVLPKMPLSNHTRIFDISYHEVDQTHTCKENAPKCLWILWYSGISFEVTDYFTFVKELTWKWYVLQYWDWM